MLGPHENVKYLAKWRRTSISCCQTLPSSFSADLRICITAKNQALHFSEVFKKQKFFTEFKAKHSFWQVIPISSRIETEEYFLEVKYAAILAEHS